MASTHNDRAELDPTDVAIIELLQKEGRITISELGL
jgi:DNA-binding Lrp family transcriptional regulator